MRMVDDAAGGGIQPAPEAQFPGKHQGDALRRAWRIGSGGADHGARTTRPAAAEATQSSSAPKATSTPILPGA